MSIAVATRRIGPEDHGTRMSLEEFARLPGEPGYRYEMEQGVIIVVDVAGIPHGRVVQAIRDALVVYRLAHPGRIDYLAEGSGAALRLPEMQSERHPDISVYLTPPPTDDPQAWDEWVPDIVVEVVSPGSEERDYEKKRVDYLKAGVRLYWIFDSAKRLATALHRRGDTWREVRLDESATLTTPLLPGFELRLADVFRVATTRIKEQDTKT